MELRTIGLSCLFVSLAYTLVRFFQVGLERKYWAKKGVFRWHIVSGTIAVWMSPYFFYHLVLGQSASVILALIQSIFVIILAVTGLRMVVLINRKDTRIYRNFIIFCLIFIQMPLVTIAASCLGLDGWAGIFCKIISLCIGILSGLIFILTVLDLVSYFLPARILSLAHEENSKLPQFLPMDIVRVFKLGSRSDTMMYANGKFGVFVAGPPLYFFAALVGLVIAWQLAFVPVVTSMGTGLRVLEFYFTGAPFINGLAVWLIFEVTLFTRGKLEKASAWVVLILGGIFPNAIMLIYPSWFGTDLVTGFLNTLFLQLN